MDQKKKKNVCHNPNGMETSHPAKDQHPFNFFLSVHDVFITANNDWTIASQYLLVCQEIRMN